MSRHVWTVGHIELGEEPIASRLLLPEGVDRCPFQFLVGTNDGAQVLEEEMLKLDSCRLVSLDVDR